MTLAEIEPSFPTTYIRAGESSARLLAVRFAGAPFQSPFDLRSPTFEKLLDEQRARRQALTALRDVLIEGLFRAVPAAPDRQMRRRLLETKRRVFNGLPPASTDLPLAPELLGSLEHYQKLTVQEANCWDAARDSVLDEVRAQLRAVWAEPRFRLACRSVSPDLVTDLERKGFPTGGDLTPVERGLYAFVSRYTSKANPFHLFAEVAFPPASGIEVDGDHEIVLEAADLLAIERRLLPEVDDPEPLYLALAPFQRLAGSLIFWISTHPGFRRVTRPAGDSALEAAIAFFAARRRGSGRPTGTLAEWRAAEAGTAQLLAELCEEGIVERYLVPDFDRLSGLPPGLEELGALHLARLPTAALAETGATIPVRFYVNSYRRTDTAAFEDAAEEVGPALQALKSFFAQDHNFSRYSYVIGAYFLDYLAHAGRNHAPYLEILRHFLKHYPEVIPRYQPEVHQSAAERERRARHTTRLCRLSGQLGLTALQGLELPGEEGPRCLCFNGPFDFVERVFYVSNVFAGAGRFVGRYLLHRRQAEPDQPDDGDLHVELAVPPEPNLNYVVRRFALGCGFEARYAHRYERWIDPSEILVARDGEGIAYHDAVSGRRLRIHYSGFQLAPQLPTEYQLLLVGHADSFHNPFQANHQDLYDPGLQVGPVCVRRESWTMGHELWEVLAAERDSLRFAARLRELVWERLTPADLWYYHWAEGGWAHYKPRFLDLRSPLSAYAFQREIAVLPADARLSLSPMRPVPRQVTELMIEV